MTFTLRTACAEDLPRIAELYKELQVDGPPPRLPAPDAPENEARFSLRVAVLEAAIVGYALAEVDETAEIPVFLRHLVTAPEARGQGVARLLLEDAAAGRAIQLNTDREGPNGAFYTHLGFHPSGYAEALRLHFRDIDAMPVYGCSTGLLSDDQCALFAAAFGLPASRVRAKQSWQKTIGAWDDDGAPLGVALFDANFPGCFPFRVARPAVATLLLREIERHALDLAGLSLMIEDDEATVGLLTAFGAESRLRLLRFARPAR